VRYTKAPAPHDGLAYRNTEEHVYSVPDSVVRICPDGATIIWYALELNKQKRRERKEASA
jgi:hypothetical protein